MAELERDGRSPQGGRGRRLLKAIGFGLVFAVPITALAFVVREKFLPVIELDERLIVAATDITRDNPWLRTALIWWQAATAPRVLYVLATIVCVVVWRRYGLRSRALWAFVTMMVAWALQLLLKEVVHRARPVVSDPVSHAPGYSFPSGHVANSAAIATVLVLLLWPLLSSAARGWLIGGLSLVVLMTCLDRVFLGVHYPSDTVAGVLFGVGLGTASYLGYLGWNPTGPDDAPPPEGRTGPEQKGDS
ncbi:phosphatase PAP2 family protein [Humibacillus xanthopallidus]|uniref:Undecaprenyl-diphosphatase n=1 Tax=Humibacillus xanthopallidus TaxID=412689 RepID=A0A543HG30_9MICO|nr:phosphatase PAP2 family protein [Humibacillus xanthopallidus]TQM57289.1 undecaprenyl-diphosphatase [Humibacillus xanthopallidus]